MGCTSPLVDSGGVMVCSSGCSTLLLDGISPTIDTSTSDWASQLVTVRKTESTENISFLHVVLTFGFNTAVSVTGIELDMFICPEWSIGAPFITLIADEEYNLAFNDASALPFQNYRPSQSSCDSLSTIDNISLGDSLAGSSYHTWHIAVSGFPEDIEWVHVGEVRFLSADRTPPLGTCGTMMKSSVQSLIMTSHAYLPHTAALPTSVPREREICQGGISTSAVIAVSAVSLLLIVTLITVILTQCLLILRMRRSIKKTPAEYTNHIPVSPNEA